MSLSVRPFGEGSQRGFTPLEREPRGIENIQRGKYLTGFTLVEVLVSLIILALVVGGIMASFIASQRFISRSTRRLQAANYARQIFEELKQAVDASNYDTGDLALTGGWIPCVGGNPPTLAAFGGQCNYSVDSPPVVGQQFRQVTVNIIWTEP